MRSVVVLGLLALVAAATATTYFKEDFEDGDAWTKRWVKSTFKGAEAGEYALSHGKYYGDVKADTGLKTKTDARFYQISSKMTDFSNKGKDLVLQFAVKHEQNIDCGGGYVKLLPAGTDQANFNGDSDYNIMFGPDICGATRRVHVIFNYKGKNHLLKKEISCENDDKNHLYTLIVHPDNTYEVKIDGVSKQTGSLKDDWDMLPPKKINDPSVSKPADWDDRRMIADPNDKKPEGWDDIPQQIKDPDAKKPEDWDDELDGTWEAPMIDNPEYKGAWEPKQIDNPAYKGSWVHPQIDNPDYFDDNELYAYKSNGVLGIEIWQVKSGTIFDRFLVTDSVAEAEKAAEDFKKSSEAERAMAEAAQKKEEEERAKAAEASAEEDKDEL